MRLPILTMKYLYKNLIAALLLLGPLAEMSAQQREIPFQAGEKAQVIIHYKYGPRMDIGKVDLAVISREDAAGRPYFNVRANVSTFSFWDSFYKIRDIYESNFYASDMAPISAMRDVHEGDFWAKNDYQWSNGGKRLRAIVDKKNRPHRDTVFNENKPIRDVINLFFACRALDIDRLLAGEVVHNIVAMDKDLLDIKLKFLCRENKKVPGQGTFRAIKIGVSVGARVMEQKDESERNKFNIAPDDKASGDENVFYGDSKIFLWITDDENRLPIFFTAPVKIGSINGRLGEHSGLKYPLTSKIE